MSCIQSRYDTRSLGQLKCPTAEQGQKNGGEKLKKSGKSEEKKEGNKNYGNGKSKRLFSFLFFLPFFLHLGWDFYCVIECRFDLDFFSGLSHSRPPPPRAMLDAVSPCPAVMQ